MTTTNPQRTNRIRTIVVIAMIVALAIAVPASAATTWRSHGSASSRAGAEFVSEVVVGATFKGADGIRLRFRSPDGTARTVRVWYYVECANGKKLNVKSSAPVKIKTKAGGAWTNVVLFPVGTKAGECFAQGGGWYSSSNKQLDMKLQSSTR